MLLARIHQLQATANVPAASGPAIACTVRLEVFGSRERRYRWKASGAGLEDIVARLSCAAVGDLVRTVDLTDCTLRWCPRRKTWRISLEPYAGSHLRVFFPPIRYSTVVRDGEAGTIAVAMQAMADALAGRGDTRSADAVGLPGYAELTGEPP